MKYCKHCMREEAEAVEFSDNASIRLLRFGEDSEGCAALHVVISVSETRKPGGKLDPKISLLYVSDYRGIAAEWSPDDNGITVFYNAEMFATRNDLTTMMGHYVFDRLQYRRTTSDYENEQLEQMLRRGEYGQIFEALGGAAESSEERARKEETE